MRRLKNTNKGITLIALIITIIVMLILVAVTISMAINGGLFEYAGKAVSDTQNAIDKEQTLANGKITIGDTIYNSIDEYIEKTSSNGERKMNIEYTTSEGNNLWSSVVTLNITFEEETEITLEQKKEIAAYMLDYSSYEEMKVGISAMAGETGGTTNVYDSMVLEAGGEDELLNYVFSILKNTVNFDEVDKLESLGIKVISVETPYGTTLYTSSLGGEVVCTLVENGTHTFKIKSGTTEIKQEVQINNLREYDAEEPHNVNIEFIDEGGGEVVFAKDDNSTWETVSTGMQTCNSSMSFKYNYEIENDKSILPLTWVISLDENFYKYYNSIEEYKKWNDIGTSNGGKSLSEILSYFSLGLGVSPRQTLIYFFLNNIGIEIIDYKMLNLAEEMINSGDSDGTYETYPQYNLGLEKDLTHGGTPLTINFTKDANIVVLSINSNIPL